MKLTAKEKKTLRKQKIELENKRRQVLKDANADNADHWTQLGKVFGVYRRNGLDLAIDLIHRIDDVDADLRSWIESLFRRNMRTSYLKSRWTWDRSEKRRELFHDQSRYLVAFRTVADGSAADRTKPVAYVHYRFDWDDDQLVLYVYEIQLEKEVQRKGLGKFFMQLCEVVGRKAGMDAIMLTVLHHDTSARAFYDALGYTVDYSSVGETEDDTTPNEIPDDLEADVKFPEGQQQFYSMIKRFSSR